MIECLFKVSQFVFNIYALVIFKALFLKQVGHLQITKHGLRWRQFKILISKGHKIYKTMYRIKNVEVVDNMKTKNS